MKFVRFIFSRLPLTAMFVAVGVFLAAFLPASSFFFSQMSEAMNPEIKVNGTGDTEIDCDNANSGGSYDLSVDYTYSLSTESYEMESIPYMPVLSFENEANLGTEITFSANNYFANEIPFFNFSFFDKTYNKIVVGENGLISFDEAQGGLYNLRFPAADNPSPLLTRNSIFATHYDLMINDQANAKVYYKIVGSYPSRKVIVTYLNANVFYCGNPSEFTSTQVVLEELTNKIQIYIKNKVSACGADTQAVVGIMDKYGALGYTPAGRNFSDGDWTASQEAWQFTPSGSRTPIVNWYQGTYSPNDEGNTLIGTGEYITVSADTNEYWVEIQYPHYQDSEGEAYSLILYDNLTVADTFPTGQDASEIVCTNIVNLQDYNQDLSVNPASYFTFTYYQDAALTIPLGNNHTVSSATEMVYVKISYNDSCYDTAILTLTSIANSMSLDPDNLSVSICDVVDDGNPEGIENDFDVSELNSLIFTVIPNGTIQYFSSASSTTPITNLSVSNGTQIWVSVFTGTCESERVGPITINFHPIPRIVDVPGNVELAVCDKNFDNTESLTAAGYDSWKELLIDNGFVSNNPSTDIVTVYATESDAENDTSPLSTIIMDTSASSYDATDNSMQVNYYVRVENSYGCFSIEEFSPRIRFYGIKANHSRYTYVCVSDSESVDVDLSCFLDNVDLDGDGNNDDGMFQKLYTEEGVLSTDFGDVASVEFYNNYTDANNGNNQISQNQTITSGDTGYQYYIAKFILCDDCAEDDHLCYTNARIQFIVLNTEPENSEVEVCSNGDSTNHIDNLNAFNEQIKPLDYFRYNFSYYSSESDAQSDTNELNAYTFDGDDYLWVKISNSVNLSSNPCVSSSSSCEGIYRIHFILSDNLSTVNEIDPIQKNVCDNDGDGIVQFDVTIFEPEITTAEAEFKYYTSFNEDTYILGGLIGSPANIEFDATSGVAQRTIYVKVKENDVACSYITKLDITLTLYAEIETQHGYLCTCFPSIGEYATYDLTTTQQQMFLDSNGQNNNYFEDMTISYFEEYSDAEEGSNVIQNQENYQSIRQVQDLYVRYESSQTGCYKIDTLTLKNLILPQPIPGSIEICDSNVNGNQDLLLNSLDEVVMPGQSLDYFFSYYATREDAEQEQNPLLSNPVIGQDETYFYEIPNGMTEIYVLVNADNGSCPESATDTGDSCNGINVVTLIQNQSISLSNTVFELPAVCDTYEDTGDIDNPTYNDGIADGINLTQLETEITAAADSEVSSILYYDSLETLNGETYPGGENAIQSPENYTNQLVSGEAVQTVYALTQSNDLCPEVVEITINVTPGPEIKPEAVYEKCIDGTVDIILDLPQGENPSDYTFSWTLPDGSTSNAGHQLLAQTQVGVYSLEIVNNESLCGTPTYSFVVETIQPPQITDLIVRNENEVQVVVFATESYPLLYSSNGVDWQASPVFRNLPYGIHSFWVKYDYNNGSCLSDPKETILIEFYNVVSPNGDGINDCFVINNLDVFQEGISDLVIFDRYGKAIYQQQSSSNFEWCGTYNGRSLPSADYWFRLVLPDGRNIKSHITVLNK